MARLRTMKRRKAMRKSVRTVARHEEVWTWMMRRIDGDQSPWLTKMASKWLGRKGDRIWRCFPKYRALVAREVSCTSPFAVAGELPASQCLEGTPVVYCMHLGCNVMYYHVLPCIGMAPMQFDLCSSCTSWVLFMMVLVRGWWR